MQAQFIVKLSNYYIIASAKSKDNRITKISYFNRNFDSMKTKPHFLAQLTFSTEEKSGKSTPVSSGYRCKIRFAFEQVDFTAMQEFTEAALVFPGDVVTAEITLFHAEKSLDKVYQGQDFDFYENEDLIGSGVITKML